MSILKLTSEIVATSVTFTPSTRASPGELAAAPSGMAKFKEVSEA